MSISGCDATDDMVIEVFDNPDPTITDSGDFCADNPSVNLTAATGGGTWSGPGITDAFAGTFDPSVANIGTNTIEYQVTIGSCLNSDNIDILVKPEIQIDIVDLQNVHCHGICDGEIVVDVTGGYPVYDYSWSSNSNTLSNICAGTYALTAVCLKTPQN
ncbi:MAG: SprB repeat-containing protein [Bacteroidales bacterium]